MTCSNYLYLCLCLLYTSPVAGRFSTLLKRFFSKEHIYDDAGLTPEERDVYKRQVILLIGIVCMVGAVCVGWILFIKNVVAELRKK